MTPSTLPAQPPALARSGGVVLPPLEFPPLRVLCVDDNPDAVESLGMLLGMIGFVTDTCRDPRFALDRYEDFRPEACVLDIAMPGLNGCELAKLLRSRARADGHSLYLIAVTAHNDRHARKRTAEAGFDLHLTKPVEPQALIDALFQIERCIRTSDSVA